MKTKQRVVFRKWKGSGDIIAFFLDQPEGPGHCMAYEHVGQHGAGAYPHPQTDPAEPWEYEELLRELIQRGYDNLRVVSKGRIAQA